MSKTERHKELELLLLSHNHRWTQSELAKRMGVHRSTIFRDIQELTEALPVREEAGKYFIDSTSYLSHIKMDVHEMLALHLATRLLVRKSGIASKHFVSLLNKISACFDKTSPVIGRFIEDTSDGFQEKLNKTESHQRAILLEKLNRAWVNQKKIRLQYRSLTNNKIKEHICSLYYFEPYADGLSLHIIAHDNTRDALVDFKFERIIDVIELEQDYMIPDDFTPSAYFKNSWGIWVIDGESEDITLKFSAHIASRILENKWHSSEVIEQLETGEIIWRGKIAKSLEMVPWIRSWGHGVEVIEPVELRKFMKNEALEMVKLYREE